MPKVDGGAYKSRCMEARRLSLIHSGIKWRRRPHREKPGRIQLDGTGRGEDSAKDGGGDGDDEERAVDRAGGPPTGLNRTGKSCRLRWVNYLHPGLKHGRMTPQEELLVLQLHAKWGNRWSRIARKLPGRTDNEIKNYWRTLMRKRAQERNGSAISSSSSSSSSTSSNASSSSSSSSPNNGPHGSGSIPEGNSLDLSQVKGYTMDQIWNEIAASDSVSNLTFEEYKDGSACSMVGTPVASPIWEACESLWRIDTQDMATMMCSMPDFLDSYCKQRIDSQKH